LFYRLNTLNIHLPPLRERNEDIPLICKGLLQRICRNEGKSAIQLSKEASHYLQHYLWPGNIRELENVLTQAVIRLRGNVIEIDNLNISNQSKSTSANPVNAICRKKLVFR
jgi:DNA-binding NtrC family response regulator